MWGLLFAGKANDPFQTIWKRNKTSCFRRNGISNPFIGLSRKRNHLTSDVTSYACFKFWIDAACVLESNEKYRQSFKYRLRMTALFSSDFVEWFTKSVEEKAAFVCLWLWHCKHKQSVFRFKWERTSTDDRRFSINKIHWTCVWNEDCIWYVQITLYCTISRYEYMSRAISIPSPLRLVIPRGSNARPNWAESTLDPNASD